MSPRFPKTRHSQDLRSCPYPNLQKGLVFEVHPLLVGSKCRWSGGLECLREAVERSSRLRWSWRKMKKGISYGIRMAAPEDVALVDGLAAGWVVGDGQAEAVFLGRFQLSSDAEANIIDGEGGEDGPGQIRQTETNGI